MFLLDMIFAGIYADAIERWLRFFCVVALIIVVIIGFVTVSVYSHRITGTYQTAYEESGYTVTFNKNSTVTKTDMASGNDEVVGTYRWGFTKLKVTIYGGETPVEEVWTYKLRGDVLILNNDMLYKQDPKKLN